MYAVGKVSRRRAMFGDFLDLPVVFLLAVQPNAQKALVETTERNSTFFKRKGWRAKHNIWFRQKRNKIILRPFTWRRLCRRQKNSSPVYLFPILKAAPRWRHVARRETTQTQRFGREKSGTPIHLRPWMCYIEVFFSLGRNKNHHQKGTEKDGGWIMYLESSARRRGLNNQKKKRETLTELLLLYIYFFTCKEKEEKKVIQVRARKFLAPKILTFRRRRTTASRRP
jgi:hypothetical protein